MVKTRKPSVKTWLPWGIGAVLLMRWAAQPIQARNKARCFQHWHSPRRLAKHRRQAQEVLLRSTGSSEALIQLKTLQESPGSGEVFLSHNWGKDCFDRDNHERVLNVNEGLKARGFTTWIDEERLEGNILGQISEGIDDSRLVLVFLTQRYYDKVNSGASTDFCRMEFEFAVRRKGSDNMLVCVMEPSLLNSVNWGGTIGLGIGGSLYVDLSSDDDFEASLDKLTDLIRQKLNSSMQVLDEKGVVSDLPLSASQVTTEKFRAFQEQLPPKPRSFQEAIVFFGVAVLAAAYYAFQATFWSLSEFLVVLQLASSELFEAALSILQSLW